jgi:hypothetical protein
MQDVSGIRIKGNATKKEQNVETMIKKKQNAIVYIME